MINEKPNDYRITRPLLYLCSLVLLASCTPDKKEQVQPSNAPDAAVAPAAATRARVQVAAPQAQIITASAGTLSADEYQAAASNAEELMQKSISTAAATECQEISGELRDPPTVTATGGVLDTSLFAVEAIKCVAGSRVPLKSYVDVRTGPDPRPVGPAYVMEVSRNRPNPQLNIRFQNALGPGNRSYDCGHHGADVEFCTNLHTHGFHVSPEPPQDDVFLKLAPTDPAFQYRFDIPNFHPPGTHWMHAHLHGSTAPQVKNGMAGALILKGDIDYWLASNYQISGNKDKIMIVQQIEDNDGNPLCGKAADGSDRTNSINGQCLPTISVQAGEVQHWRFIHAGVSATVNLAVVNEYGDSVSLREYARDGITMDGAIDQQTITLQPGYRSDVLIKVPQCPLGRYPCTFDLVDAQSDADESLLGIAEPHNIIAKLAVVRLRSEPMILPPADSLHFHSPYPFIPNDELKKENEEYVTQKIWFANETNPNDPDGPTLKTVNGSVYPDGSTEQLTLNTATLWKIWVGDKQSSTASHPFHIHVNPFQVTDLDPNGRPFHYWKDTLLISGSDNKGEDNAIIVRSRYEDFDGEFVLHCHNLNHEDEGMMKKVEIIE